MSKITIGFVEHEPDEKFIAHVQNIIATEKEINLLGKSHQQVAAAYLLNQGLRTGECYNSPYSLATIDKSNFLPAHHYALTNSSLLELKENPLKNTRVVVIDITKTFKHVQLIRSFAKTLKTAPSALLLLDSRCDTLKHIVLKYDGTPASSSSILAFSQLFSRKAANAEKVTLISPVTFKKSQVSVEKEFVKNATTHYNALGFIKLPLNSAKDFFTYATKNNVNLLILSKQDLTETLKIITSKPFHSQLKRQTLSIFIG